VSRGQAGQANVGRPSQGRLVLRIAAALLAAVLASVDTATQDPQTGQNIAPVYEGWEQNADGSFNLIFGYMNRNWNEWVDVPVGPGNTLDPGGPDQGQPTHFMPRRNQFVFRVKVPKEFGTKELVWTLTSNGKTEKAYGTLKPDYVVDSTVMMANFGAGGQLGNVPDLVGNTAPRLELLGEKTLRAKVGQPVPLTVVAVDDGKPKVRNMPAFVGAQRPLPNSANGLRVAFFKYRGAGAVTFDPPQFTVWEDTRDGANSPWAPGFKTPPLPDDNKWTARATFSAPGEYVLRCVAHDGGLATTENVRVIVEN
jgi:hypothetical protein